MLSCVVHNFIDNRYTSSIDGEVEVAGAISTLMEALRSRL